MVYQTRHSEESNDPTSTNGQRQSVISDSTSDKNILAAIDNHALKDQFGEDKAVFAEILIEFVDPGKAIIEELKQQTEQLKQ